MSVSYPASPTATASAAASVRAKTITLHSMRPAATPSQRSYRLVDQQGAPHPVLDDLYDSLDAAWAEAQSWWQEHAGADHAPVGIGVEVSTASGEWRTLRHPGI
jgi:hypothetical protein